MKLKGFAIFLLALGIVAAGLPSDARATAQHVVVTRFTSTPFALNDDGFGGLRASYVNIGGSLVLSLQKLGLTNSASSVGSFLQGLGRVHPTTCGFDYLVSGSWAGQQDPLINIVTTDGVIHQTFGPAFEPTTDVGSGYTRVTVDCTNSGQMVPPVTANEVLSSASLVMFSGPDAKDGTGTPGFAIVTNIQINNNIATPVRRTIRLRNH